MSMTACLSAPNCDEPAFYESAEGGERIVAPDDLDDLASNREMGIPEASPRAPREPGSGCLDRPPTLQISRPEEEAEEAEEVEEAEETEETDETEETEES